MHFSNFVNIGSTIHTILIFVSESCGKQLCTQNLYNNSMYPYSVVFVLLVLYLDSVKIIVKSMELMPHFALCGRPAQCIMHASSSMSSTSKFLIRLRVYIS